MAVVGEKQMAIDALARSVRSRQPLLPSISVIVAPMPGAIDATVDVRA
jgi:hypothetical protein